MLELHRPTARDAQLEQLKLMLSDTEEVSVPETIFTYGLESTGKTFVVKHFLETQQIPHAVFHCVELYNTRLMYESILQQFLGEHRKCDNVSEFISQLKKELDDNQKYVILFEESERFRETDTHLRQVFCRLQEVTNLNICVIWESRIQWSRFLPNRDLPDPLQIHFPQYTKSELTELLIQDLPGEKSEDFKSNYVTLVLSIFHVVARSLSELSHIANLHYKDYCRPVEEGECTEEDIKKLWFNVEKQLKKCLSTVHLREVASSQIRDIFKQHEKEKLEGSANTSVASNTRLTVELPYYSKYLLIAAYLSSYNPQKTDKRFFVKHHGKQRKTANTIRAKEKFNSQLTGPKPFPLERMLAIFYNIVEEPVNPTANIYTQISSLVRLRLISIVGLDQIDQPKYKCNVTLDFIRTISNTLKFDISKYLYSQ